MGNSHKICPARAENKEIIVICFANESLNSYKTFFAQCKVNKNMFVSNFSYLNLWFFLLLTALHFQAQKLLLRDGTLANFTIQSPSTLPTITLGLPANSRVKYEHIWTYFLACVFFLFLIPWNPDLFCASCCVFVIINVRFLVFSASIKFYLYIQAEGELSSLKVSRVPMVTAGGTPVFLPLSREDQAGQMNHHLPVIILEPSGLVHPPIITGETKALNTLEYISHRALKYCSLWPPSHC